MRAVALVLLLLAGKAVADPAGPVRVTIECESSGRTKACPAFLLGFVDANKVLLTAPRASAEVIVYAHIAEIAQADRVHLRFVGTIVGAPPLIETEIDLDTRADDDTQRAQLEPVFLRGMALYVGTRYPALVTVAFAAPDDKTMAKPETTAWELAYDVGGFGNWTNQYQSYHGFSSLTLSRLASKSRAAASISASGGANRQPPLIADDGTVISVNTKQWSLAADGSGAWLYNDHWSFGGSTRIWRDDPKGQFRYGYTAKAGVEWDKYRADDPRGNRLAVLYVGGYELEGYNVRNVLGERFAQYPTHTLIASGSVRKDKVSLGLSLSVSSELLHPLRRHTVSASPFVEWKIGGHVDLSLSLSATKRQVVAPDPSYIDPTDFEQLSRLSYAEPLSMNGSLNLNIHWDRTNAARNDRFTDI